MFCDDTITILAQNARQAAQKLYTCSPTQINTGLSTLASLLRIHQTEILDANSIDIAAGNEKGLSAALLDRLLLTPARLEALAMSVDSIATQPDVMGVITESWTRPNGLTIEAVKVPLGVIGIIYESRPNVTVDAAALCLKSGNAAI
jgi:glutamate-5-semialdehyde dehydrogenase